MPLVEPEELFSQWFWSISTFGFIFLNFLEMNQGIILDMNQVQSSLLNELNFALGLIVHFSHELNLWFSS